MTNNIFLSWSGTLSNAVAYAFHQYLPVILQNSASFFSPESIAKDADWFNKIKTELVSVKTGIIFLTKENINSEWIILEAGGILSKGSICVLLCDLDISDLKDSKSFFQYLNVTKLNNKPDLLKFFVTLKNVISPDVSDDVIKLTFDKFYEDLKDEVENNRTKAINMTPETSTFAKLTGRWKLEYKKMDGTFRGQEFLRIDDSGKYYLSVAGDEKYYFQLNVLSSDASRFVWQKIQTIDEKPSELVHSIEDLTLENGVLLRGSDTSGFKLTYTKIE
ncbi:hypothetical protein GCM10027275_41790 [Rhabdobacter roseus]|uniref:TIR domain-containing protein n=1 Tax=Rhabdobacter roseus TaxID=1655419 RepID=A0A840TX47_9BACT|nr:hypothetical protein [Rhabdobacter roseus]MBB5286157.1 hypothetical protein [Rhabdobacter roseus]